MTSTLKNCVIKGEIEFDEDGRASITGSVLAKRGAVLANVAIQKR